MLNVIFIVGMFVSMLAIGVLGWRRLKDQESNDAGFQSKLDADDERARKGRSQRSE